MLQNYEFYCANLGGINQTQHQPPPPSHQQPQAIANDDARMQHFINSCLQGIDDKIKPINDNIKNLAGEVGSLNQRMITQEQRTSIMENNFGHLAAQGFPLVKYQFPPQQVFQQIPQ